MTEFFNYFHHALDWKTVSPEGSLMRRLQFIAAQSAMVFKLKLPEVVFPTQRTNQMNSGINHQTADNHSSFNFKPDLSTQSIENDNGCHSASFNEEFFVFRDSTPHLKDSIYFDDTEEAHKKLITSYDPANFKNVDLTTSNSSAYKKTL